MEKYERRSDVEEKYRWDLTIYFKNNEEFLNTLKECEKDVNKLTSYTDCLTSAKRLKEYLDFDINLSSKLMNLDIYAFTLSDQDLNESEPIELVGKINNLLTTYSVNNAFFEPLLLNLEEDEYNKLIKEEILSKYVPYLNKLYRYKKHHLKEEEEKLVSKLTQTLSSYGSTSSTLLNNNHNYGTVIVDGEETILTPTNYRIIMKKLPRDEREKVYHQFFKVLDQYASTSASLLDNYVKTVNSLAKIYNFSSPWERKLFGQKLNDKVFTSLIDACIEKKDVIKKYSNLKAKVLGVKKLMPWDAPMDLYKIDKEYSIEDAQNICIKSLSVLGNDYLDRFKLLIDKRCVDYCTYKGKCSGGYNVSGISSRLSHILMNYNGDLDSVSTLIHEGGHFTHHTYIYDNNEPLYRDHSTVICEVASLTNECLLSHYLLNNGTKEEALAGLDNIIGVIYSNLFGAVQEGDMEKEFYEYSLNGGTLTKDYLYNLCEESIKKFYPKKELDDEYQKCAWIRRSHYYMNFYLFSYAICISVATNLAKRIINNEEGILDKYKEFLSSGSNKDIIDVFKIIDVDLEDKNIYLNAIDYFEECVDKFKKIYEEVK